MNSTRTVAVRLDNQVAQEYERLAQLKGDKLGTYLRDLLTSNLQMASIERQADHDAEIAIMFARKVEENKVDFEELRKFLMNT
jgi:hypothetical protein